MSNTDAQASGDIVECVAAILDGTIQGYSTVCTFATFLFTLPSMESRAVLRAYVGYLHRVFWPTPAEYEEEGWRWAEAGEGGSSIEWVPSPLGCGNVQRKLVLPSVAKG